MAIPSTKILGIRVDRVDMDETLGLIDQFIATRKTHQLVVINVAKIIKARKNKYLKRVIDSAALCGADGVPLLWISKLLGEPIKGRVNGTDLMEKLVERSAAKGYRIFFFGAEEWVLKKTIEIYQNHYPDLQVAGYRNGYFSEDEEGEIASRIRDSKADILFVAFGTPKKELFIDKYKHVMNVPVIHGVGGSFDVVAGKTRRAPLWMQRSGLEWFYRILQEPGRMWKRYLVTNTIFSFLVLLQILKMKNFNN